MAPEEIGALLAGLENIAAELKRLNDNLEKGVDHHKVVHYTSGRSEWSREGEFHFKDEK